MTEWLKALDAVVRAIPKGKTLSYAQVAMRAGKPGAARAVVRGLYSLDGAPWWRVIKSDGTVAKEMLRRQGPKLKKEGVVLKGRRVPEENRLK
jgi:methylated-DNA-protein-cysteine methyltransferase-like protein